MSRSGFVEIPESIAFRSDIGGDGDVGVGDDEDADADRRGRGPSADFGLLPGLPFPGVVVAGLRGGPGASPPMLNNVSESFVLERLGLRDC